MSRARFEEDIALIAGSMRAIRFALISALIIAAGLILCWLVSA